VSDSVEKRFEPDIYIHTYIKIVYDCMLSTVYRFNNTTGDE